MNEDSDKWRDLAMSKHQDCERLRAKLESAIDKANSHEQKLDKARNYQHYLEQKLESLTISNQDTITELQNNKELLAKAKYLLLQRKLQNQELQAQVNKLSSDVSELREALAAEQELNHNLSAKIAKLLSRWSLQVATSNDLDDAVA